MAKSKNFESHRRIPYLYLLILGIFLFLVSAVPIFFIQCLNTAQYGWVRISIAIGGACIAACLPGVIHIKIQLLDYTASATSALAILISLLYKSPDLIEKFNPCIQTFTITVSTHGSKGPDDLVLRNQGIVKIIYEETDSKRIDEDGNAILNGINSKYLSKTVKFLIDHPVYKLKYPDSSYHLAPNTTVSLEVFPKNLDIFQGHVYQEASGDVIPGARISILDIETTSDKNGFFQLHIPEAKQALVQNITVQKEGYVTFHHPIEIDSETDIPITLVKK